MNWDDSTVGNQEIGKENKESIPQQEVKKKRSIERPNPSRDRTQGQGAGREKRSSSTPKPVQEKRPVRAIRNLREAVISNSRN